LIDEKITSTEIVTRFIANIITRLKKERTIYLYSIKKNSTMFECDAYDILEFLPGASLGSMRDFRKI